MTTGMTSRRQKEAYAFSPNSVSSGRTAERQSPAAHTSAANSVQTLSRLEAKRPASRSRPVARREA